MLTIKINLIQFKQLEIFFRIKPNFKFKCHLRKTPMMKLKKILIIINLNLLLIFKNKLIKFKMNKCVKTTAKKQNISYKAKISKVIFVQNVQ